MNRNITLDILKLFMVCMVVGIHAEFLADIISLGYYLTVNGIFRMAVPIFILINGFYFYSILVKGNTSKWFKRILYLYLFWMLFYIYFWFQPSEVSLLVMIQRIAFGFWHLWYLPGIIGAAILTILLKNSPPQLIILAILVTFLTGVLIQYSGNYHLIDSLLIDKYFNYNWVHRNFLFLAFPFFGIGFLINKFDIHKKVSLKMSVALTIMGLVLLIFESYFNYNSILRDGGFDNYIALLLVCPALFIVFMNLKFQGDSKQLALYATGVYFIHPMFLLIHNKLLYLNETLLTFVVITLSVVSSYFLIKANKKLKFIL